MKKIVILSVCLLFLTACTDIKNNAESDSQNTATSSAITGSSITAAAVSGSAAGSAAANEVDKYFYTNLEGEKSPLYWDGKYEGKQSVSVIAAYDANEYRQVEGDHYYYVRKLWAEEDNPFYMDTVTYQIYRDKGKEAGTFKLYANEEDEWDSFTGMVKYGNDFFAEYDEGEYTKLGKTDLRKNAPELELVENFEDFPPYDFYNDRLYLYDQQNYAVTCENLKGEVIGSYSVPLEESDEDAYNFIGIVDGNLLIENSKENESILLSYDMENNEMTEVADLHFSQEDGNVQYNTYTFNSDTIFVERFGEKSSTLAGGHYGRYLYEIPLNGKMQRVFDESINGYCYDKNYIFYIDKKWNIHKYNRKTGKDERISDMKAMKIDCTSKGLWVQKYNKQVINDFGESGHLVELYYMDFNGKNVKKLAD